MWYVEICVTDVGELDTETADNEEQEGEFYENTAADEMVDHEEGKFYENRGVVFSSNNETQAVILKSLAAKKNRVGRVEYLDSAWTIV